MTLTTRPVASGIQPRRGRHLLRALGAAAALLIIVVGAPLLLMTLGTALPVDLGVLTPGALTWPDDGGLLILVILALAWASWAVVILSVGVETWSAIRRVPTPRLPGLAGPQRLAAALVAAMIVAAGSGVAAQAAAAPMGALGSLVAGAGTSAADAHRASPADVAATASRLPASPGGPAAPHAGLVTSSDPGEVLPTVTTQRHDTLWLLAEQFLGSGERFTEIVALNEGAAQPDGRTLRADGRLYPGWTLRMPADASFHAERSQRHLVEKGETLWEVAQEELGDPARYPEIFDINAGDLSPTGAG
jgi:nucleoid-associated protein YgaU